LGVKSLLDPYGWLQYIRNMTRPLRIEYPGAWYHVMNRGRRAEKFFADSEDFMVFIALLQETSEMFAIRISAFNRLGGSSLCLTLMVGCNIFAI
jgi:hypothetical protein